MGCHSQPAPITLSGAEDRNLMTQYQDLHVFGGVAAGEQGQPAERPDHEQVEEAEEHEHPG
jgi:hypothetical protein